MVADFIMNLIKILTVKPYLNELKNSVGFYTTNINP